MYIISIETYISLVYIHVYYQYIYMNIISIYTWKLSVYIHICLCKKFLSLCINIYICMYMY